MRHNILKRCKRMGDGWERDLVWNLGLAMSLLLLSTCCKKKKKTMMMDEKTKSTQAQKTQSEQDPVSAKTPDLSKDAILHTEIVVDPDSEMDVKKDGLKWSKVARMWRTPRNEDSCWEVHSERQEEGDEGHRHVIETIQCIGGHIIDTEPYTPTEDGPEVRYIYIPPPPPLPSDETQSDPAAASAMTAKSLFTTKRSGRKSNRSPPPGFARKSKMSAPKSKATSPKKANKSEILTAPTQPI